MLITKIHLRHLLFAAWACAMSLICAYLLARHLVPLPAPAVADPALAAAIARTRTPAEAGRWLTLHLLLSDCPCSRQIADHLIARGPFSPQLTAERVVLIEPATDLEDRLRRRGFAVEPIRQAALRARYPVQAAPLLLVVDEQGTVRYAGGYSARKRGPALLDTQILTSLRQGQPPHPLPLFGCPASETLRAAIDPFRLSTNAKDSD